MSGKIYTLFPALTHDQVLGACMVSVTAALTILLVVAIFKAPMEG